MGVGSGPFWIGGCQPSYGASDEDGSDPLLRQEQTYDFFVYAEEEGFDVTVTVTRPYDGTREWMVDVLGHVVNSVDELRATSS